MESLVRGKARVDLGQLYCAVVTGMRRVKGGEREQRSRVVL